MKKQNMQPVQPNISMGKKVFRVLSNIFFTFLGLLLIMVIFMMAGLLISIVGLMTNGLSNQDYLDDGNVALIRIDGVIQTTSSDGFLSDSGISSEYIVNQLQDAQNDEKILAVILQINSPGGSGVASDEVSQQIMSMSKPVISVIRDIGASGAYWIASSSEYIFASKFSIVGSIGVIASSLNFAKFLDDYNISYQRFVAGENKDFGTPFREVTPEQRARFQSQLDELHNLFIEQVATNRQLDVSYVRTLSDGFTFTGQEALDKRLIDAIGGIPSAKDYLLEKYNITAVLSDYNYEPSLLQSVLGMNSDAYVAVGRGIGQSLKPNMESSVVVRT